MKIPYEIREKLVARAPGRAVLVALEELVTKDVYLLVHDVNERSISHRFAMYLQDELPNFDVDCEYNRTGVDPKRIDYLYVGTDARDTDGKTVFPDVIAHIRGCNNRNHLVIEFKKSTCAVDCEFDFKKLRGYKGDDRLNYKYALFIELMVGGRSGVSRVEWVDV